MPSSFFKQHDSARKFTDTLILNGSGVNLSGCSVVFWAQNLNTGFYFSGSGTITDATNGGVEYSFTSGNLTYPGDYYSEWRVTFSDSSVTSIPNDGYNRFSILYKLAHLTT